MRITWMLCAAAVIAISQACSCGPSPTNGGPDAGSFDAGASVLAHHKNPSRDGVYTDPAFTKAAIPNLHLDPGFVSNTGIGAVYSQPLFMENGPGGADTLFVATENDDVYALDAKTGTQIWHTSLGTPVPDWTWMVTGCGSVYPLGVTGTPVIDAAARRLFVAAVVTPTDGGTSGVHTMFAVSVDDGGIQWSVDVQSAVPAFLSSHQNQRGALALLDGVVYVPYGGLDGDCNPYHGWVMGFPTANPHNVTAWSTPDQVAGASLSGSGIWAPSGIATDGTSLFVATGNHNTAYAPDWDGGWSASTGYGDAIIGLAPGPSFTFSTANYFAPPDFVTLDANDWDLGSMGPVLFDVPGASPSHLAIAYGKTRAPWLVNRDNLGGVGGQLSTFAGAPNADEFGTMVAYRTATSSYVGLPAGFTNCVPGGAGTDLTVLRVSAASPPQLSMGWCAASGGNGGIIVSQSAPQTDVVVWRIGGSASGALRAFDGDNGARFDLRDSGAFPTIPAPMEHWVPPLIAKGRLYVPADGAIYAYQVQ